MTARLLAPEDLARILKLEVSTVARQHRDWAARLGMPRPVPLTKALRWDGAAISAWLDQLGGLAALRPAASAAAPDAPPEPGALARALAAEIDAPNLGAGR